MIGRIVCDVLTKPVKREKRFCRFFVREFYLGDDQGCEGRLKDIQFHR